MERTPASAPAARLALLLAFKRKMAKHAMAEEYVVYPILHEDADRAAATEQLYREHADMKIHLFTLQQVLREQEAWVTQVRALHAEIERHARQEEEEEFPRLRAMAQERKSSRLNLNIRQEEALIL